MVTKDEGAKVDAKENDSSHMTKKRKFESSSEENENEGWRVKLYNRPPVVSRPTTEEDRSEKTQMTSMEMLDLREWSGDTYMSSDSCDNTLDDNFISTTSAVEEGAPTITDLLPVDILRDCIFRNFLGPGHYLFVASSCTTFRQAYETAMSAENRNETSYENAAASVQCAEFCLMTGGCYYGIGEAAVRMGKIAIIEFVYQRFSLYSLDAGLGDIEAFDIAVFAEAGKCGQLEVFKWAVTNGIDWKESAEMAAINAAEGGHVAVLEWMLENGAHRDNDFEGCAYDAAKQGHVSIFEWLKRHEIEVESIDDCWIIAADQGHVPVLDWLLNEGYRIHARVMPQAARSGQIAVLQWARNHQLEWSSKTCALAAYHGQLEALMWLRTNGCPWDGNVLHWAQRQGHLDVVEWATNNGCPTGADRIYSLYELLFE